MPTPVDGWTTDTPRVFSARIDNVAVLKFESPIDTAPLAATRKRSTLLVRSTKSLESVVPKKLLAGSVFALPLSDQFAPVAKVEAATRLTLLVAGSMSSTSSLPLPVGSPPSVSPLVAVIVVAVKLLTARSVPANAVARFAHDNTPLVSVVRM